MNADYKSRKGTDKRTSRVLWVCLLVWGLVACVAPPATGQLAFDEAEFGVAVTSGAVDASNSPIEIRSDFTREDGMIYAVFEVKRIEPGTQLYVRWKSDPLQFEEQSTPLTADRAYENIYLEFHLQPVQGNTLSALEAGEYEVQLFVNEKAGPKATFRVSGE